jgi:hypothetical protein
LGWSLALGSLIPSFGTEALAQGEPVIAHQAAECWPEDQFPQLAAGIQPGQEILTAKVYFRSDKYPDFYFVEMTPKPSIENFLAILPKPGPETKRVIYYLEAVDATFTGARTEEYDPEVDDPCQRRTPAAYIGENPGIVVGATKAGAAAIPPGFQAAGIAGFITAAGASSAAGGGVSIVTVVAVAGAAAGAGGAVIVTADGGTSTTAPNSQVPSTTSVPADGPATTTVPTTTTTAPPPTTTTASSTSVPGTATSVPPATTTIPPTTTTSLSTTTTSISSSTTTTTTAPPVTACFTSTKLNSCVWQFDASCSTGPIVQYNWAIDPGGIMPTPRPPVSQSGQVVTVDWNPPTYGGCSGAPLISVQLTVVGSSGQTDSKGQGVNIDLKASVERGEIRTSFSSFLGITPFDGTSQGFVVVNAARVDETSNSAPARHVFPGLAGKNTIEAHTVVESRGGGFWRFDFSAAERFLPGSIQAEAGTVAWRDGRAIVFRFTGMPGERIRFTFELSP